jgi:hypothetical protein
MTFFQSTSEYRKDVLVHPGYRLIYAVDSEKQKRMFLGTSCLRPLFVKMELCSPSTDSHKLSQEATFEASPGIDASTYIKVASYTEERDGFYPLADRNYFRQVSFVFCTFSLRREKENGQTASNIHLQEFGCKAALLDHSFLCSDIVLWSKTGPRNDQSERTWHQPEHPNQMFMNGGRTSIAGKSAYCTEARENSANNFYAELKRIKCVSC